MNTGARRPAASTTAPLEVGRRTDDPAARLVVFPHAGAGPASYASWVAWLPPQWDYATAFLPGREAKYGLPHPSSLRSFAREVAGTICRDDAAGRVPLVLFGHSMGALVAAEVAREIGPQRPRGLDRLIVSGSRPPSAAQLAEPVHELPTSELVTLLGGLGGDTGRVAADSRFLAYWEPIIRGDLRLSWEYASLPTPFIDIPITAVAAAADQRAGRAQMAGWAAVTSGGFQLVEAPGDHFYLFASDGLAVLRDVVGGSVRARPSYPTEEGSGLS